jgi:DNA-binding LytR/AlgR family response regulator
MEYKVLIVEDDELSVAIIKRNLSFYPDFTILGVVGTVNDAIQFVQSHQIDVIFLDMQLPDGEGFDILYHVPGKPAVVVITSDEFYAFTAFDYGVLDFLKKTILANRFKKCINKIVDFLDKQIQNKTDGSTSLFVKSGLKHIKVDIKELVYAEAENEYVKIYLVRNKSYLINTSLKQLVTKLQDYNCIQVHRTFLVNLQYIDYIDDGMIVLNNAQQIPIGKTFKNEVLKFLK